MCTGMSYLPLTSSSLGLNDTSVPRTAQGLISMILLHLLVLSHEGTQPVVQTWLPGHS